MEKVQIVAFDWILGEAQPLPLALNARTRRLLWALNCCSTYPCPSLLAAETALTTRSGASKSPSQPVLLVPRLASSTSTRIFDDKNSHEVLNLEKTLFRNGAKRHHWLVGQAYSDIITEPREQMVPAIPRATVLYIPLSPRSRAWRHAPPFRQRHTRRVRLCGYPSDWEEDE